MKRVYLFRKFECPDGHVTQKFVDASDEAVMCEHEGCRFAAVRPEVFTYCGTAVHGDELDYIDHNLGRDPVHIRSKTQRRALMAAAGLSEFIRHTPVPGTDKSPYTTDWSKGSIDPYTLANAEELVRRVYGSGGGPVTRQTEEEEYAAIPLPANAFSLEASNDDMTKVTALYEKTNAQTSDC